MIIIIVDDESLALNSMTAQTQKVFPNDKIQSFLSAAEALDYAQKNKPDIAFLDIEMSEMNGIELAKSIQAINPEVNIIFTTGYQKYSLEALRLHASGYLIKPVTAADISEELKALRYPLPEGAGEKLLRVKCFGCFDVFTMDGNTLNFKRSKAKELFAVLVDREGTALNTAQLCAILFEGTEDTPAQHAQFRVMMSALRKALDSVGASEVLSVSHNSFAVRMDRLDCDYYKWLANRNDRSVNPHNDYMAQYSWAEPHAEYIRRLVN